MDNTRLSYLLKRHLDGQLTEDEQKELQAFLKDGDASSQVSRVLEDLMHTVHAENTDAQSVARIFENVFQADKKVALASERRIIPWMRYAAAAVLLIVLGSSAFFYFKNDNRTAIIQRTQVGGEDVQPGSDRAILTLADGRQIILDSTAGNLVTEGGVTVINLQGQLNYSDSVGANANAVAYHTISTPRGGQYQVVLAEGTRVWLNAASNLRFPTAFPGAERVVELKGEGYFDVAHNKAKPFRVKVESAEVQVLGTQFNVNSYEDEPAMQTTLVEGAVKISRGTESMLLQPGEQAIVRSGGDQEIRINRNVDVQEIVGWKTGMFIFKSADIRSIMRQLSRWYDIEVEYRDEIRSSFTGMISRKVTISEVLNLLEQTGAVTFLVKDRKIIVKK